MRIMPRRPLPPAVDTIEGLKHIERLSDLYLSQVLAEGIREPLAVLRRMVELDTERLSREIEALKAYERSPNGVPLYGFGPAARGKAMVEYIAQTTYERINAA